MSDSYVTSQATIKCSCGDKCAKLTVYPDRTVFLTEKPMANISDHVSMYNIAPFGKCHTVAYPPTGSATAANHGHLTPMPCVPGTVSEWINGKSDYIIKGKPALLKSSYCRCQWGGIITITDDGQINTGNPDLEKQQIETEWKAKYQTENLAPKQLGIQEAFDVAGFKEYKNASNLSKKAENLAPAQLGIQKAKAFIGENIDVTGMSKDEAGEFIESVKNERRKFAKQFYKDAGFSESDTEAHLNGIDFTKPITIENVPPPQIFYQYQTVNCKDGKLKRGNYYAIDINAKPTDLGIYGYYAFFKGGIEYKKEHVIIEDVKPQRALVSTASGAIDNWSVSGKTIKTKGGAIQYFMPIH